MKYQSRLDAQRDAVTAAKYASKSISARQFAEFLLSKHKRPRDFVQLLQFLREYEYINFI